MNRDEKREAWRVHINAHKESGQSQRAYCAEHGLSERQFSYWKSQLDRPEGARFVPVRVHTRSPVMMELPGGIRLSIPAEALDSLLPTILRCMAKAVG